MSSIVAVFAVLGFVAGMVWMVVALIRRRNLRQPGILLVVTFSMFVAALIIAPSQGEQPAASQAVPRTTSTPRPTPTPIPVISISIQQLKTEYDTNQIVADNKYKGQILQVSGAVVANISRGLGGKPYASLNTGASFELWSATCRFRDEAQVLELQRGQTITVKAKNTGMSVGIVGFEDCEVVK